MTPSTSSQPPLAQLTGGLPLLPQYHGFGFQDMAPKIMLRVRTPPPPRDQRKRGCVLRVSEQGGCGGRLRVRAVGRGSAFCRQRWRWTKGLISCEYLWQSSTKSEM